MSAVLCCLFVRALVGHINVQQVEKGKVYEFNMRTARMYGVGEHVCDDLEEFTPGEWQDGIQAVFDLSQQRKLKLYVTDNYILLFSRK